MQKAPGLVTAACLTLAVIVGCKPGRDSSRAPQSNSTVTTKSLESGCEAPDIWFPVTPPPTNGPLRPDNECDFYQWAWQSFLYVTQAEAAGGSPRFLAFKTPDEIFNSQPPPRFPEKLQESASERKLLQLAPRLEKEPDPVPSDSVLQATSHGILVAKNGRAVYYSIHLNSVFENFVHDHNLTNATALHDFNGDTPFPIGTLELKASWMVVDDSVDTSKYFVTNAVISTLKKEGNRIVVDTAATQQVKVALVGMHVVGEPEGHPEFVWATFEHIDNAPDLPSGMTPTDATPVDSSRDWTFYARGTSANKCNRKAILSLPPQPPGSQILSPPTNVFRQFPFGGEDHPDEQIIPLNNSVHSKLPANLNVWKNYKLIGATWLNKPADDFSVGKNFGQLNDSTPGIIAGEDRLSNSTMETFLQDPSSKNPSCFYCHRTEDEKRDDQTGAPIFTGKDTTFSHVLANVSFSLLNQKDSEGTA